MGIGVSLLLIAIGAVLTFAVTATANGIDITVVGVILMIVGGVGLAISMLFLATWAPFYHVYRPDPGTRVRQVDETTTVVRDI
jgi:membrane-bound ClpP family serine protease